MEEWKDVRGYEGIYQVSDIGRVRNKNTNRFLKLSTHRGYIYAGLYKDRKHGFKSVHRLVGLAFLETPNDGDQINHKNGIKKDNRVENLEWCTAQENIIHGYKTGLIRYVYSDDTVRLIRKLYKRNKFGYMKVAKLLNIPHRIVVRQIINGQRRKTVI